jgi:hypothetical protein
MNRPIPEPRVAAAGDGVSAETVATPSESHDGNGNGSPAAEEPVESLDGNGDGLSSEPSESTAEF